MPGLWTGVAIVAGIMIVASLVEALARVTDSTEETNT